MAALRRGTHTHISLSLSFSNITCNLSKNWGCPCPLRMVPVCSSNRSARVDFPWSTWAMIEKFLTKWGGYCVKSTFSSFSPASTDSVEKQTFLNNPVLALHEPPSENNVCCNLVGKQMLLLSKQDTNLGNSGRTLQASTPRSPLCWTSANFGGLTAWVAKPGLESSRFKTLEMDSPIRCKKKVLRIRGAW